ncbi:MAG: hypothetical protein IKX57_01475 [Oscillospiraceae bacterium]|nr:hypothetical protein [Oscillospiraceae bacterium]MBR5722269.1 hypothetical protein [Oscillospiraceae bacterium]
MKKRIVYCAVVTMIAFAVWLAGQLILMLDFPESSLAVSRGWAITVLAAACIWNLAHFRRLEKKKREDEENENYKGVY